MSALNFTPIHPQVVSLTQSGGSTSIEPHLQLQLITSVYASIYVAHFVGSHHVVLQDAASHVKHFPLVKVFKVSLYVYLWVKVK